MYIRVCVHNRYSKFEKLQFLKMVFNFKCWGLKQILLNVLLLLKAIEKLNFFKSYLLFTDFFVNVVKC